MQSNVAVDRLDAAVASGCGCEAEDHLPIHALKQITLLDFADSYRSVDVAGTHFPGDSCDIDLTVRDGSDIQQGAWRNQYLELELRPAIGTRVTMSPFARLVLRNGSNAQLELLLDLANRGQLHPDLIRHVKNSLGSESV